MIRKTKLSKKDRKALEHEVVRNHRQRKENKRDMNRLLMYYILKKAHAFGWECDDEIIDDINTCCNLRKVMS